jgi:hypothetical protein
MAGIFSSPKAPPPPPPIEMPKTPTVDQVQVDRDRADMMRRRRGRAATILTDGSGKLDEGSVASKNLLGM